MWRLRPHAPGQDYSSCTPGAQGAPPRPRRPAGTSAIAPQARQGWALGRARPRVWACHRTADGRARASAISSVGIAPSLRSAFYGAVLARRTRPSVPHPKSKPGAERARFGAAKQPQP